MPKKLATFQFCRFWYAKVSFGGLLFVKTLQKAKRGLLRVFQNIFWMIPFVIIKSSSRRCHQIQVSCLYLWILRLFIVAAEGLGDQTDVLGFLYGNVPTAIDDLGSQSF